MGDQLVAETAAFERYEREQSPEDFATGPRIRDVGGLEQIGQATITHEQPGREPRRRVNPLGRFTERAGALEGLPAVSKGRVGKRRRVAREERRIDPAERKS